MKVLGKKSAKVARFLHQIKNSSEKKILSVLWTIIDNIQTIRNPTYQSSSTIILRKQLIIGMHLYTELLVAVLNSGFIMIPSTRDPIRMGQLKSVTTTRTSNFE